MANIAKHGLTNEILSFLFYSVYIDFYLLALSYYAAKSSCITHSEKEIGDFSISDLCFIVCGKVVAFQFSGLLLSFFSVSITSVIRGTTD